MAVGCGITQGDGSRLTLGKTLEIAAWVECKGAVAIIGQRAGIWPANNGVCQVIDVIVRIDVVALESAGNSRSVFNC